MVGKFCCHRAKLLMSRVTGNDPLQMDRWEWRGRSRITRERAGL